jgi:3'(2'), 5'-bisphosphate nucleotidase
MSLPQYSAVKDLLLQLSESLLTWKQESEIGGSWVGTQLKTEADNRAHEVINTGLTRISPDIPVISEEDEAQQLQERPQQYWLIDPIDGTASYSNGFAGYVTQLALIENHIPVYGCIVAPETKEVFEGAQGAGAYKNGRRLPPQIEPDEITLVDNYPEPRGFAATIMRGLPCHDYLESGSLGLKLCRVLDGSAQLFAKDVIVRDWDLAPAHCMMNELGAPLTRLHGASIDYSEDYEKDGFVAATTQPIHAKFIAWHTIQRQKNKGDHKEAQR